MKEQPTTSIGSMGTRTGSGISPRPRITEEDFIAGMKKDPHQVKAVSAMIEYINNNLFTLENDISELRDDLTPVMGEFELELDDTCANPTSSPLERVLEDMRVRLYNSGARIRDMRKRLTI